MNLFVDIFSDFTKGPYTNTHLGAFCQNFLKTEAGRIQADFSALAATICSNVQTHFSTLYQALAKLPLGSNVVVLYSAQYSVVGRAGKGRD